MILHAMRSQILTHALVIGHSYKLLPNAGNYRITRQLFREWKRRIEQLQLNPAYGSEKKLGDLTYFVYIHRHSL